jgi:hypothetical protein
MDFEVEPYVGVGPIAFGLTRAEVRRRMAVPVEAFMKTPSSAAPTDAFDALGVHVYYDLHERCEAVELGRRHVVPTFRGRALVGRSRIELQRWLSLLDPDLRIEEGRITSLKLGFGLYAPSDDPEALVEGAIVFRSGYYSYE